MVTKCCGNCERTIRMCVVDMLLTCRRTTIKRSQMLHPAELLENRTYSIPSSSPIPQAWLNFQAPRVHFG